MERGAPFWGENLELGAFLSRRAEAGEGELLCCPGYPYGHGDGCAQGPEHAGKTGIKHPKLSLSLSHRSLRHKRWMSGSRSVGGTENPG